MMSLILRGIDFMLVPLLVFVVLSSFARAPRAADFEQVGGPYDGHVTSFVQDPGTGKIYATGMGRGTGGGVFVSVDGGDSWNRVTGNIQLAETTFNNPPHYGEFYENIGLPNVSGTLAGNLRLGIDPTTTPATLYVAYFYTATVPMVFRSIDEGANWVSFSSGLPGGNPYTFAMAPSGYMYLAMIGGVGVYRLPPGGAVWEACGTGTTNARAIAINGANGDIYFTNQQNTLDAQRPAVFRSTDGGISFTGVVVPTSLVGGGAVDAGSYNRLLTSIAVDSSQVPAVIHVGVKDRYNWLNEVSIATGGHLRSTDAGATWTESVVMNVESLTVDAAGRVFLGQADNASYYGAVYRSTDRGVTFARIIHPGIVDAAAVIALQSLPSGLLMAGADGAYRSSDNGSTWTHLDRRGLNASRRTTDVAVGSDGTIYSASNQHGVSVSQDGGATWRIANGSGAFRIGSLFVYTIAVSPVTNHVFAGTGLTSDTAVTGMWRSTDRGASWTRVSGFTASYQGTEITFALNGNVIFGGMFGPGGVFVSTDGGVTAASSSNPPGTWPGVFSPTYSLATNPVTGDIYAGTETQATWLSTDHGLSFTEQSWTTAFSNGCTGQFGNKGNVFSVAVDPTGNTVYEAALRGLFKTTDKGASWQEVPVPGFGGCGQVGWHVFVDPNGAIYYFRVESGGGLAPKLERSTDGGVTWSSFNTGLAVDSRGAAATMGMALNPIDGKIYTGMSGVTSGIKQGPTGLFRTTQGVIPCAVAGPCGDCDGSGFVTILDAFLAARMDSSLAPTPAAGSAQFNACNVQGTVFPAPGATITVLDALFIARFVVGLTPLVCC